MNESCQCGSPATTFFGVPMTGDTPSSHLLVCDEHKADLFKQWGSHSGRGQNTPVISRANSATHRKWVADG